MGALVRKLLQPTPSIWIGHFFTTHKQFCFSMLHMTRYLYMANFSWCQNLPLNRLNWVSVYLLMNSMLTNNVSYALFLNSYLLSFSPFDNLKTCPASSPSRPAGTSNFRISWKKMTKNHFLALYSQNGRDFTFSTFSLILSRLLPLPPPYAAERKEREEWRNKKVRRRKEAKWFKTNALSLYLDMPWQFDHDNSSLF